MLQKINESSAKHRLIFESSRKTYESWVFSRTTVAKHNVERTERKQSNVRLHDKSRPSWQMFIPFYQLFIEAPIQIHVRKGGLARTLLFCLQPCAGCSKESSWCTRCANLTFVGYCV